MKNADMPAMPHKCTGDAIRCFDGNGCECAMAGNPPPTISPGAQAVSAESGKGQPVGFWSLTESGRVEYCDGKPMFMAGPVGNYLHPVALYPHPDPVRAALVEALKEASESLGHMGAEHLKSRADAALKAAGWCCHED